jgi:uncharacterized Zn-finger protein
VTKAIFGRSMPDFETITIDGTVAACNGGGGPLGHPRVYLNLGPGGRVCCPYCSRVFVNRAAPRGAADEIVPHAPDGRSA